MHEPACSPILPTMQATLIPSAEVRPLEPVGEITVLLKELSSGRRKALEDLMPKVYDELRAIAQRHMVGERPGHTLSSTAVVHEAYLRIAELSEIDWQDRNHFFAIASQAMRRVLVNHAIARSTKKRGGGRRRVDLIDNLALEEPDVDGILALHQALEKLEQLDARQVRIAECRFFGGMTVEETAAALGVSPATVKRDWASARAWLNRELSHG